MQSAELYPEFFIHHETRWRRPSKSTNLAIEDLVHDVQAELEAS